MAPGLETGVIYISVEGQVKVRSSVKVTPRYTCDETCEIREPLVNRLKEGRAFFRDIAMSFVLVTFSLRLAEEVQSETMLISHCSDRRSEAERIGLYKRMSFA